VRSGAFGIAELTANSDSDALNARDAVGQLKSQHTVAGGLDCQLPRRRDEDVGRDRAESASLECNVPGVHGRLGEAGPWLYQAINSSLRRSTLRVIGDDTLSRTKAFSRCQPAV
jgi:hypothetical protein